MKLLNEPPGGGWEGWVWQRTLLLGKCLGVRAIFCCVPSLWQSSDDEVWTVLGIPALCPVGAREYFSEDFLVRGGWWWDALVVVIASAFVRVHCGVLAAAESLSSVSRVVGQTDSADEHARLARKWTTTSLFFGSACPCCRRTCSLCFGVLFCVERCLSNPFPFFLFVSPF